jgi:hypothetical protein
VSTDNVTRAIGKYKTPSKDELRKFVSYLKSTKMFDDLANSGKTVCF